MGLCHRWRLSRICPSDTPGTVQYRRAAIVAAVTQHGLAADQRGKRAPNPESTRRSTRQRSTTAKWVRSGAMTTSLQLDFFGEECLGRFKGARQHIASTALPEKTTLSFLGVDSATRHCSEASCVCPPRGVFLRKHCHSKQFVNTWVPRCLGLLRLQK